MITSNKRQQLNEQRMQTEAYWLRSLVDFEKLL